MNLGVCLRGRGEVGGKKKLEANSIPEGLWMPKQILTWELPPKVNGE